jgi:hypothetical protein
MKVVHQHRAEKQRHRHLAEVMANRFGLRTGSMDSTVVLHVPRMVPALDETIIGLGDGGIAENVGVVDRINSIQAARHHISAALAAIGPSRRRSHAENAHSGDDCKRDENLVSTHGSLLQSA